MEKDHNFDLLGLHQLSVVSNSNYFDHHRPFEGLIDVVSAALPSADVYPVDRSQGVSCRRREGRERLTEVA